MYWGWGTQRGTQRPGAVDGWAGGGVVILKPYLALMYMEKRAAAGGAVGLVTDQQSSTYMCCS